MRIYYSGGSTGQTVAENLLEEVNVMPSVVYTVRKMNPNGRLQALIDKKGKRNGGKTFLDSGAHSLYSENVIDKDLMNRTSYISRGDIPTSVLLGVVATEDCAPASLKKEWKDRYQYYESDDFWEYLESYTTFLKNHGDGLDYYATLDAIFHPEKTYEIQKVLEDDYGLKPIPIVHWGADLKWVKKYLDEGYDYLGIGGLGQMVSRTQYEDWADRLFELLCKNGRPRVRTHGFAMTSFKYMTRYPWHSVDSVTWAKLAAYGKIIIPRKKNGEYLYRFQTREEMPMLLAVSDTSTYNFHYGRLHKDEKKYVEEWLDHLGVPVGDTKYGLSERDQSEVARQRIRDMRKRGIIVSEEEEDEIAGGRKKQVKVKGDITKREGYGVTTQHHARCLANLLFYQKVQQDLTDNPLRFKQGRKTFGLRINNEEE